MILHSHSWRDWSAIWKYNLLTSLLSNLDRISTIKWRVLIFNKWCIICNLSFHIRTKLGGQFIDQLPEIIRWKNVPNNKVIVFCTIRKRCFDVNIFVLKWQNIPRKNHLSSIKFIVIGKSVVNFKIRSLKQTPLFLQFSHRSNNCNFIQ